MVNTKLAVSLDFSSVQAVVSTSFDKVNFTLDSVFETFELGEIEIKENNIDNQISIKRLKNSLAFYEVFISVCFQAIEHIQVPRHFENLMEIDQADL